MKKVLLSITLFCLFSVLFIPALTIADTNPTPGPIVQCGNDTNKNNKIDDDERCTINDFIETIGRVYNFIVWNIATPLAVLAVLIGGIMILVSAGNPNLISMGKKILWVALIGIALVFCAYLIINVILGAIGASPLN